MTNRRELTFLRGVKAAIAGLLLSLAVLLPGAAAAGERLTVVELFSSQGCPLCPPAEVYLGELAYRDGLLPLAFHVDYWDYLGWQDKFAEPAFSRRQKRYSVRLGLPYVYTPQIVIDGYLDAPGGRPGEVEEEIDAARSADGDAVDISLTRLSPKRLRIQMPAIDLKEGPVDVVMVTFDEKIETRIAVGENSGLVQTNYHVVRDVKSIASWNGTGFDQIVPFGDADGGTDFCAILVQQRGQGRIIGAAKVDMRPAGAQRAPKG